MSNKKLLGVTIATAAALAFASVPINNAFAKGTVNHVPTHAKEKANVKRL
jgi:cytochrome c oxidase assembly protein Cox11